jgi:large subunit ribosomal protein L4
MKSALSSKVNEEAILVLDSLELKEAKTKEMAKVLDNFNINKKALIVLEGKNETVERAARNIPGVKLAYVNTLNVLDILNYDNFVITQDAVKKVEEVYV